MRISPVWIGAVAAAGLLGGLAANGIPRPGYAAPTIQPLPFIQTTQVTVLGTSSVTVVSTGAVVSVGVENSATSAESALTANNAIMQRIIARLTSLAIPLKDLETSGLSVNPQYSNSAVPTITGYQVSDAVNVTVPRVNQVGTVLGDAVAAGANQVNGVTFIGGNPKNAYRMSYARALLNAAAQAQAIAATLHERIIGVVRVHVQSGSSPLPLNTFALAAAPRTPVLPGQQAETVSLKVVYRLTPDSSRIG